MHPLLTKLLRYQPGSLVDLAKSYLNKPNVRDLERLSPAELNRLRGFLKGVRVTFKHARTKRARPINGLVNDGGGYEFEKDGTPTTVEARVPPPLRLCQRASLLR